MTARFRPLQPAFRGVGGRFVRTLEAIAYSDPARGLVAVVPPGFYSDGASVPSWAWALLRSGWVELLPFGLLHDYLYRKGAQVFLNGESFPVPGRSWADTTGVEALRTLGEGERKDARLVRPALWLAGSSRWQRRNVVWPD